MGINDENFPVGANSLGAPKDPRVSGDVPGSASSGPGNLNVYRYPLDVGSVEYPHYAVFYISKRQGDVGENEVLTNQNVNVDVSNQNRPDRIESATLRAGLATYQFVAGGATLGTEVVKSTASTFGGRANTAVKATGAVLGASAALSAAMDDVVRNRERVFLRDAIALYMNDVPSTTYRAGWDTADVGVLGGAPEVISNVGQNFSSAVNAFQGGNILEGGGELLGAGKAAIQGLGGMAAVAALKNQKGPLSAFGDASALTQTSSGIAVNPFKVQMFKSMGFRSFSFNYVFLPKNKEEYNQARDIIKTFKRYMHPTKKGTFFLGYPAEFSIQFFFRNAPNEHLFKISSCALTDMKVAYGGADFVTFKGTEGAPAEISMSLTFTELELLTEDRIKDNY